MMKKRKPTAPGTIIEEHYIKPLKISKSSLAKALGIARNTLYKILDGRARITADIAVRLAKVLNTTPELWLNLQLKVDVWEAEKNPAIRRENIRPLTALVARAR